MAILRSVARPAPMPALERALDAISLEWLNDNHPGLADALEIEVDRGAEPAEVRRRVMAITARPELARRCEQAARALVEAGGQGGGP